MYVSAEAVINSTLTDIRKNGHESPYFCVCVFYTGDSGVCHSSGD
jgi:hypothetical protein